MLLLLISGCVPNQPTTRPVIYTGPTESMEQVIAGINANNVRIPTLWAHQYFEVTTFDEKHVQHGPINGDGTLQYESPGNLRVRGNKAGVPIFDIGANADNYWFHLTADTKTFWHGKFENLDQNESRLPLRPDQITQVLAVGQLDPEMLHDPVPTMRFNGDADVYMFTWSTLNGNHWVIPREIWYDRQTKLPVKVILYDTTGRAVLRANLSAHKPLEMRDKSTGPMVATKIRMLFPENGTKLNFELEDMVLKNGPMPNARSFTMPAPADAKVIDLDESPKS